MIYSSYDFIFFVICFLFLFYKFPRAGSLILLAASLLWYFSWGMQATIALVGISVFNYLFLFIKDRHFRRHSRILLQTLIFLNILFFVACKFMPAFFSRAGSPLGLSFFMLSLIALTADRLRDPTLEKPSFTGFLLVPFFFPALVGGPIQKEKLLLPQLKEKNQAALLNIIDGALVFLYGYFKYYLLYLNLTRAIFYLERQSVLQTSYVALGVACLIYAFRAYIEFSSYCDMGRGVAKAFGIQLNANFRPFYYAKNPIEFWQKWNISLGEWIRDYITLPLLLKYGKRLGYTLIMLFSFLLVGIWHGIAPNWIFFGLANGLLIAVYFQIQAQLKNSRAIVFLSGVLLVILLHLTNGLLQNPDFYKMLTFTQQLPPQKYCELPSFLNWNSLISLAGLFVFEYWQEKSANLDFFLKAPFKFKLVAVLSAIGLFLFVLHTGFSVTSKELPPLYFKF